MTTLLYIMFYGWLLGVAFFTGIMFVAVRLLGGRENFTTFFNHTQEKNYQVHHIDWAIVISVVFWPHTLATMTFNNMVKAQRPGVREHS